MNGPVSDVSVWHTLRKWRPNILSINMKSLPQEHKCVIPILVRPNQEHHWDLSVSQSTRSPCPNCKGENNWANTQHQHQSSVCSHWPLRVHVSHSLPLRIRKIDYLWPAGSLESRMWTKTISDFSRQNSWPSGCTDFSSSAVKPNRNLFSTFISKKAGMFTT